MLQFDTISIEDVEFAMKDKLPVNVFDDEEINWRLKCEATYSLAVQQQSIEIERLQKERELKIPRNFDFNE